jgi:hypothetical protein
MVTGMTVTLQCIAWTSLWPVIGLKLHAGQEALIEDCGPRVIP